MNFLYAFMLLYVEHNKYRKKNVAGRERSINYLGDEVAVMSQLMENSYPLRNQTASNLSDANLSLAEFFMQQRLKMYILFGIDPIRAKVLKN